MKKLLVLLFASLLVLGACGQKEESTSKDDTKETKEVKKDAKKEDKKESKDKEVSKKTEPKSEEQSTEEVATNEQQSTEEVTTNEQPTQEQQTVEQPVQQPVQEAPTQDEITQQFKNGQDVNGQVDNEGNKYVQAQGGGDAMGYYKPDGSFCTVGGCVSPEAQERMDREMEEMEKSDE